MRSWRGWCLLGLVLACAIALPHRPHTESRVVLEDPLLRESMRLEESQVMESVQESLQLYTHNATLSNLDAPPKDFDLEQLKNTKLIGNSKLLHLLARALLQNDDPLPVDTDGNPLMDLDRIQRTPLEQLKIEQLFQTAVEKMHTKHLWDEMKKMSTESGDIHVADAMSSETFLALKDIFDIFIDEVRAEAWEQFQDWVGPPKDVPVESDQPTTCSDAHCRAKYGKFDELTPQQVAKVLDRNIVNMKEAITQVKLFGEFTSGQTLAYGSMILSELTDDKFQRVSLCEFTLARLKDRGLITDDTKAHVEQFLDAEFPDLMVFPKDPVEASEIKDASLQGTTMAKFFDLPFRNDPDMMEIWFNLNKLEPGPLPGPSKRTPACSKIDWKQTDGTTCRRFPYADEMTRCEVTLAWNLANTCEGRKANWRQLADTFVIYAISKGNTKRGEPKRMSMQDFVRAVKMLQIGKSIIKDNDGRSPIPQRVPKDTTAVETFAVARKCPVRSMTFDLSQLAPDEKLLQAEWYQTVSKRKEIELRWKLLENKQNMGLQKACNLYKHMACEDCAESAGCRDVAAYNLKSQQLIEAVSGVRNPGVRAVQNAFDYSFSDQQVDCVCSNCASGAGKCKHVETGACTNDKTCGPEYEPCICGQITKSDFWSAFYHYPKLVDGVSRLQLKNAYMRMRHFRARIPFLLKGLDHNAEIGDPITGEAPEVSGWPEDKQFDFQMTDESEVEDTGYAWEGDESTYTKRFVDDGMLGTDWTNVPEHGWLLFYIVMTDYRANANRLGSVERACATASRYARAKGGRYGCGPAPSADLYTAGGDDPVSKEAAAQCRLSLEGTIGPRIAKKFQTQAACQYLFAHTSGWAKPNIHWPTGMAEKRIAQGTPKELCEAHTTELYKRKLSQLPNHPSTPPTSIESVTCSTFGALAAECEELKMRHARARLRCNCKHKLRRLTNAGAILEHPETAAVWDQTADNERSNQICTTKHRMTPHKWVNLYFFNWNGGLGFRPRFDPFVPCGPNPPRERVVSGECPEYPSKGSTFDPDLLPFAFGPVFDPRANKDKVQIMETLFLTARGSEDDYVDVNSNPTIPWPNLPFIPFDAPKTSSSLEFPPRLIFRDGPQTSGSLMGLVHLGPPAIIEPDDNPVSSEVPIALGVLPAVFEDTGYNGVPVLLPPSRDVPLSGGSTVGSLPILGPPQWLAPNIQPGEKARLDWPVAWGVGEPETMLFPTPDADFLPVLTPSRYQSQKQIEDRGK